MQAEDLTIVLKLWFAIAIAATILLMILKSMKLHCKDNNHIFLHSTEI